MANEKNLRKYVEWLIKKELLEFNIKIRIVNDTIKELLGQNGEHLSVDTK